MNYIEFKFTVSPREPFTEILTVNIAEIGFDSFVDTDSGVDAYIVAETFSEKLFKELDIFKNTQVKISYTRSNIEPQNWNHLWESNFTPVEIGEQLIIRAPFHQQSNKPDIEIVIEPKMSFGTGHHETTYLMSEQILKMNWQHKTVLDMGSGTGILAILAAKLGATNCHAIDIEEWAVENALENCARNNISTVIVDKGSANLLQGRNYDCILANINKNVLLADMHQYAKSLNKGGDILLSGFFITDADDIIAYGTNIGLTELNRNSKNNWCMLHLKKN